MIAQLFANNLPAWLGLLGLLIGFSRHGASFGHLGVLTF